MTISKEQKAIYNKRYYTKKREKILSHMKEKITCPICNIQIQRVNKKSHQRSKRHHKNYDKLVSLSQNVKFGGKYQEAPV